MEIIINDQKHTVDASNSIDDILQKINITETKGLAIAVNNSIVPRRDWSQYSLKENDKVVLIRATQGG